MREFLDLPIFLGSNFYWWEVFHQGERFPPNFQVFANAVRLAKRIQPFRDRIGSPFRVTSWYRDQETNRRVGGDPQSLHLKGAAVDIHTSRFEELIRLLEREWQGGLGIYKSHVHLDLGPKRKWTKL